jgi:hypothetical protein
MSDAGEWTLISPLASFRCCLDDIFFCLSLAYLRGGVLVLRRLSLKMSTRGASRLFTGIRLDDDDEVKEVLPSTQRPPILLPLMVRLALPMCSRHPTHMPLLKWVMGMVIETCQR